MLLLTKTYTKYADSILSYEIYMYLCVQKRHFIILNQSVLISSEILYQ